MKSEFGKKFNHDPWALNYDENVKNEAHPIRAGYDHVLTSVAAAAPQHEGALILDIGIGTGNLSRRLAPSVKIVGLDNSAGMMAVAREKLANHQVEFVHADMLAFFDQTRPPFDGVISTYTIHHLTEIEKERLFANIWRQLKPGGRAAFGDLMFADATARERAIEYYTAKGQGNIAFDIQDEFFWLVDHATAALTSLGFNVTSRQVSDLSWVLFAQKPAGTGTHEVEE